MKVIGIDPAPAKGLHVYDGEHMHLPIRQVQTFFEETKAEQDLLLCWDAPLTGPPEAVLKVKKVWE